jgi:hypothetical protein
MKTLKRADALHIEAAQGWIELDNPGEAQRELDEIEIPCRENPEVLELRRKTSAMAQHWDTCLDLAETLVESLPENRPRGSTWPPASIHSITPKKPTRPSLKLSTPSPTIRLFPTNSPAMPAKCACGTKQKPGSTKLLPAATPMN